MGKRVTVVMPVRNEARSIEESLGSVLAQDYPAGDLDVLVVDGLSDDGTRELVADLADRSARAGGPRVELVDNPGKIVPTGLNIAIDRAGGEVIVRVDGHCSIAQDYVRRCVEALEETGADNVGGVQRAVGTSPLGRAIAAAMSTPFGVGSARNRYATKPMWTDIVWLGAFRREVFDLVGRFDEELVRNQDDEFDYRLVEAGGRIWLDPDIRCEYRPRESLRSLWRQYYQYGLYKVLVIRKRGRVPSLRHLVPSGFVLGVAAATVASAAARTPLFVGAAVGAYAVGNLAASVWTARSDIKMLPFLPIVFATLHVSYGIGFLIGLWRWRGRREERTEAVAR